MNKNLKLISSTITKLYQNFTSLYKSLHISILEEKNRTLQGHNFGDLSFLEPGGRCAKTNGLECTVIYDSPVLRKTESIPSVYYDSSTRDSSVPSDSGNGSELGTLDKSLTDDDLSSLSESEVAPEYFSDFQIDMGPSLLDDIMGTLDKMQKRRNKKAKQPIKI